MKRDSKIKNVSIPTDRRSRQQGGAEHYADQLHLIRFVIETYETCISLPTISTLVLNEDGDMVGQRVLLPASAAVEFIVDCQRITTKALDGNVELQNAWFRLLKGQDIEASLQHGLVKALGRPYQISGLSPAKYFRQIRKGSVEAQRRAA